MGTATVVADLGKIDTSFRTVLRRLNDAGRVLRIETPVSIECELAGIAHALQGDKALFFEQVEGWEMPVCSNLLFSRPNCETAFGLDVAGIRATMARAIHDRVPPVVVEAAPCQEVVITENLDLGRLLPILKYAPDDVARFVTGGIVILRDPLTGAHNASYHRLQLHGGNRTGIRVEFGRHLGVALDHARQLGQRLQIASVIGTDIAVTYVAAFMGAQMPVDADELAAAGGLRGSPLPVVRGRTIDLLIPAETEIVLEGSIDPNELQHEGPFGEFIQQYSAAGPSPVFEVSAVTMRRQPIYYAVNAAGLDSTFLRKYVMESALQEALRAAVPIVKDVAMTDGGLHRFHVVIQVEKRRPQDDGFQRNAALAAFATLKDLDLVILVDDDVDAHNPVDVEYALATRFEASQDIVLIPNARGHEMQRISRNGIRSKLVLDCTVPFEQRERFRRVQVADVDPSRYRTISAPVGAAVHEVFGPSPGQAG